MKLFNLQFIRELIVHGFLEVAVKGRYENNKREVDQIKDHLGLPKEPYFGEQT